MVIANCARVAKQNSMRGFRNWRPPTPIQQDAAASKARAQVCDATLCRCSDAPVSFLSVIDEAESMR